MVDADAVADVNWIASLVPHFSDPKVAGAVASSPKESRLPCPTAAGVPA